ncbi:restriction endonuclease subunit S [Glaesserella parasuis]|uniref:restriction endonuclease subunit S n=1 Tax=Glaesserella parasuis TaxID=738 RepID=UPI0024367324|nr:restriction endonuclease subunit S [Glaesserella parasuis]MDG6273367.1 restriction endonuclease subunit S [Glaesserella parasuis]MDG6277554.1 restriction endonuclease subunit S [Glaesserella parasuis]MDG6298437.1 restriction endonuclease subunit S [Glaesserella parasuis]MDG6320071.1 restriction endonuclease subunit S [Glaesserella parasuis]MDP0336519.1 restriction endonuclease subunit S [Glaesserella parasuis]
MIESRFIEKLLNGREITWKSLGEIATIRTGETVSKQKIADNPGIYPVINSGKEPLGYINEWNTENDPIGVTTRGAGVGSVTWQEGKYFRGNLNYSVSIKDKNLLVVKFLYHILLEYQNEIHNLSTFTGIPALNASELKKLVIPIPPLDVQQEIVRILDAFTSLTAELTAELTSRQKQYQYFRDKLLNFDDISDRGGYETNSITKALLHNKKVVFKALGNISENLDFMRKPITSGLREKGNIPYYGASGIVDYVKDYIFEGDYLLVSEDGANLLARNTPIAFSISGKNWVNNHAHVLKFNTYTERRFVEFYLNNIDLTPYISGASQPKLNKNNLSNIKIPAPPFEEQQRIVTILDKFETLTNSIAEGLPKEIELRRKQYEYYREKLLSFSQ